MLYLTQTEEKPKRLWVQQLAHTLFASSLRNLCNNFSASLSDILYRTLTPPPCAKPCHVVGLQELRTPGNNGLLQGRALVGSKRGIGLQWFRRLRTSAKVGMLSGAVVAFVYDLWLLVFLGS